MLRAVGREIWVAEHDFSMGAIDFGGRMTVIRLPDEALLLCSPIPIDDALASELRALGEVAYVVAPNAFHHLFVAAAIERYPSATLCGTAALAKKRPDLRFDVRLDEGTPAAWGDALLGLVVRGMPSVDEAVFYHRPSRSLVLTDLVFHLHEPKGWLSRVFFRLLGVLGRLAQSPLFRLTTKDRAAAEASLEPMWSWDFERVVVAHGRIVEGPDAKARLREAMRWMCPVREDRRLPASSPIG